jgi:hypothetical protein
VEVETYQVLQTEELVNLLSILPMQCQMLIMRELEILVGRLQTMLLALEYQTTAPVWQQDHAQLAQLDLALHI